MPEVPLFELRLYQAGQVGYVSLLPAQVASASWRTTLETGYDSASFTLATSQDTGSVAGLAKAGRRIEAWGRSRDGASQVRLWSGRIVQARRDSAPPYAFTVSAVGVWSKVARLLVPTPLVFSSRVDLSQAFAAAASSALGSSSESFQIDAPAVGLTTDSLEEAYEQPLRDAASALLSLGAGAISMGGDVVGDQPGETLGSAGAFGQERIYLRPFEDGNAPARWTISLPDPALRVVRRQTEEDASRLVNVLKIVGGSLQNENKLAAPTQDNARLDRIYRPGSGGTNLLPNLTAGFENGGGDWTYSGGASRKADTDVYGPSDGNGKWFVLLDNLGEKILQRPLVPGGVQAGRTYVFNARIRQATNKADGSASTDAVTLRLRFFTAGGVQVGADVTAPFTPAGAGVWRDAQVSAAAPASATQIEVEIELTTRTPGATASTLGVAIDNCSLYDGSLIAQRGWFLKQKTPLSGASAKIERQNWQAPGQGGAFGPYALEVSGTSSDDYDNDFWIVPGTSPNEELAAVSGGQGLTLSYWLKRLPDGSSNPKLILEFDWRDKEGRYISPSRATIAAGALTTSFVQYTLTASAPANATGAIVRLRCRGNGGFVLDAAQLRDSSEVTGEFVQGDSWQSDHRASSMPGLTAPQQASNALYGDVYERVEEPLIRSQADADAYALAVFKARCLPIQRPSVEVSGHAEAWRPGQWLRAIGREGASFLASPLPIAEAEGRWEGGQLSTTLTLGAPPDTRQRLLQRLLEGVSKGAAGSSSRSYATPSSGSALAYASGALPDGTTNGQLMRWDNALGLWIVNSVASLLDTGLTLTSAAVGDTPLTIQGMDNQVTPLIRTRSGLNQLPIWQHQNSLGAVRAYMKEGTNAPFFCTGPDVANLSLGSFGYRLATAGGDADAEFYGNFGGFAGIGTIGARAFLISTNSTQRIDVRPPTFNATFPRSHTGFSTLFMANTYTYTGAAGTVPLSSSVAVATMTLASTNAITVPILSSLLLAAPPINGANVTAPIRASAAFGTGSNLTNALVLYRFSAAQTADLATFLDENYAALSRIDNVGAFRGPHKSADGSSGVTITEAGVTVKDGLRTGGTLLVPVANGGTGATVAAAARTNLGLGSAATANTPVTGDASAIQVVLGSDTRLTNARTPTAHNQDASTITSGTLAAARLPLHNLLNGGGTDIGVGIVRILEGNPSAGVISVGAWPTGTESMRLLIVHNPSGSSATISFPSTTGTITGSTTLAAGATSIWSLSSFSAGVWNARRITRPVFPTVRRSFFESAKAV